MSVVRFVLGVLVAAGVVSLAQPVWADGDVVAQSQLQSIVRYEVEEDYALGVNRFQLDTHTEIIGWQIHPSIYFGRQDGLDSGLTLVWQQAENQVSLSKDGVRLTRRF